MKPINKVLKIKELIRDPFLKYPHLSENEKMVGKLAIMGYTSEEIVEIIDMPLGTINTYIRNICRAVGCRKHQLPGKLIEEIKRILDENSK